MGNVPGNNQHNTSQLRKRQRKGTAHVRTPKTQRPRRYQAHTDEQHRRRVVRQTGLRRPLIRFVADYAEPVSLKGAGQRQQRQAALVRARTANAEGIRTNASSRAELPRFPRNAAA